MNEPEKKNSEKIEITFNHEAKSYFEAILINGKAILDKDRLLKIEKRAKKYVKSHEKFNVVTMCVEISKRDESLKDKINYCFMVGFILSQASSKLRAVVAKVMLHNISERLSGVPETFLKTALRNEAEVVRNTAPFACIIIAGATFFLNSSKADILKEAMGSKVDSISTIEALEEALKELKKSLS